MSSREIAELTGKEHRHVCRDISNMLLELGLPWEGYVQNWAHPQNRQTYIEYLLPKDLTITLVSGYSVVMRHQSRLATLHRHPLGRAGGATAGRREGSHQLPRSAAPGRLASHTPMKHTNCHAPGCRTAVRSIYSSYCQAHRTALRRNGHILQTTVTAPEVRPFIKLIAKLQADSPTNPAWSILRKRWAALVDHATATVALMQAGKPFVKHHGAAAQHLLGVAGAVDADLAIQTAMAVAMHRSEDPRRYQGDRAELFQMARLVLKLSPENVGKSWNHSRQSARTVRKDVAPKVLEHIGCLLREAFAFPAGVLLAAEKAKKTAAADEEAALVAALKGLPY